MRNRALVLLLLLALGLAALPAAAQNSLCEVDLSTVTALLTRAQAASASGDAAGALALVNRADSLLATLENRCDLPAVAASAELGDSYSATGFSLRLPPGWAVDAETAAASGGLLIGSTPDAARTMANAEPALPAGQAGMLIAYGTPATISGGALMGGDLEAVVRYFQIILSSQYLLGGDPAYLLLEGRAAAQLAFSGAGFAGHLVIVEPAPGVFAAVAAAAPRGELNALIPAAQAVAASIAPAAQ